MLRAFTVLFLIGLWSCSSAVESFQSFVDQSSFRFLGGTLFSGIEEASTKQILLDSGSVADKRVVVEGRVLEIGKHHTYLILEDDASKLLVLTTGLDSEAVELARNSHVRIWGSIESGTRGLPLLRAKSLRGG